MQLYVVATVALWFSVAVLHHVIALSTAFVLRSEADFLLTGILPTYAPSKLYVSSDAVDEIENLQSYVALACVYLSMGPHTRFHSGSPLV